MKRISLLSLLALSSLSAEVRDWTSADGSRTFSGEVTSYDKATKTVKVTVEGQEVSFTTDKLSEADRTYLSTWDPAAKPAVPSETEATETPATEPAAVSTVAQLLATDKLQRLNGENFVAASLEKKPKYFLLYYSASW